MESSYKNFSGYILAGGKSSRMGQDKAFLEINGTTFLNHALKILRPVCKDRIKVVLNSNQTHIAKRLSKNETPYVFDIYTDRGPLGGIHASLNDCKTEFAVILAVDLPFVTPEAVKKLAKTASKFNSDAVVPKQKGGRIQPLCAVYEVAKCLPWLKASFDSRLSTSVTEFSESIATRFIEQEDLSDDKNLLANINRQEDYEHFSFGFEP